MGYRITIHTDETVQPILVHELFFKSESAWLEHPLYLHAKIPRQIRDQVTIKHEYVAIESRPKSQRQISWKYSLN